MPVIVVIVVVAIIIILFIHYFESRGHVLKGKYR